MQLSLNLLITLALNLIPLIGYIFLGWDAFEILASYLIHSLALFITFIGNRLYFKKQTRYPPFFATIAMVLIAPIYAAFTYFYLLATFDKLNDFGSLDGSVKLKLMLTKLMPINPWLIFAIALTVEIFLQVLVALSKSVSNQKKHSDYYMLWRLGLLHFFILISLLVMAIVQDQTFSYLFLIIGFKILLDVGFDWWLTKKAKQVLRGKTK